MSYRDDTDAALARADALERELAQARAERDRFHAELVAQPVAPKPSPEHVMTQKELGDLLREVAGGFREAHQVVVVRAVIGAVLMIAFVVGSIHSPAFFPIVLVSVVMLGIGLAQLGDNSQPVLYELTHYPSAILELALARSGVVLHTRTCCALCYSQNPPELLVRLAKRCPDAVVGRS